MTNVLVALYNRKGSRRGKSSTYIRLLSQKNTSGTADNIGVYNTKVSNRGGFTMRQMRQAPRAPTT